MSERCDKCGQDLPEPTVESLQALVQELEKRVAALEARPWWTLQQAPQPIALPAVPWPAEITWTSIGNMGSLKMVPR